MTMTMVASCSSLSNSLRVRLISKEVTSTFTATTTHAVSLFPSSYYNYRRLFIRKDRRAVPVKVITPPPSNQPPDQDQDQDHSVSSASQIVTSFYQGINRRDLSSVEELISPDCVYEDLIFAQPFLGRKAILEFFQSFIDSISSDLVFVIDDISEQDNSAVGVTWHLEWKGKSFPFSKGCSFYRLDHIKGNLQIIYGRDCVEPALKPGELALIAIRGVTWLLQKFPQLADRL